MNYIGITGHRKLIRDFIKRKSAVAAEYKEKNSKKNLNINDIDINAEK